MRFTYNLARVLGMSRRRLLAEVDANELAHWEALALLEARELEQLRKKDDLKAMTERGVTDTKRRLKGRRGG